MSIGKNIRRLREAHGMSQMDLARIAGVTDKAVSTWENDLKIPRMGAIQKMADHFGIAKSDVIDEPEDHISFSAFSSSAASTASSAASFSPHEPAGDADRAFLSDLRALLEKHGLIDAGEALSPRKAEALFHAAALLRATLRGD